MDKKVNNKQLVYTIKDLCRVCYTCVRECPVKAIRIINGQAEIIPERCIACGNCTKVCSQGAKDFLDSTTSVFSILKENKLNIAIVAPSFPAEFTEIEDHQTFVCMIKKLGFDHVYEVSFGADIVAHHYKYLLDSNKSKKYISSDCPAIVSYIENYHPELVEYLTPIVSPMVALARILREKHGTNFNLVFIGPCIAKKDESMEVDETLTFSELRKMFSAKNIVPENSHTADFDIPHGGKGAAFPVSRGMMQTVNIEDDIIEGRAIIASGRESFPEVIQEFKNNTIEAQHLELLCCNGCIMGPGMSKKGQQYLRKTAVGNYVKKKMKEFDTNNWQQEFDKYVSIDASREFKKKNINSGLLSDKKIDEVLASMGKKTKQDHLDCGACGYNTCRNHAIAVANGLAEVEMCLPYTIDKLHNSVNDLAISNENLVTIKQALKQTEKLAHMGQLSAGIAHELNNPLGVIIMYSNILLEECDKESELYSDLKLITEQSERCKKIVGGLLNFARKNQVNHSSVNAHNLIKQSLSSVIIPNNVQIKLETRIKNPTIEVDQEQMIQVISNLVKNGIEAMPGGGNISIYSYDDENKIYVDISDTGTGIKQEDLDKVFEPFFTTKGIGQGTGLGLATAYGIVKMHKGQIIVESNIDIKNGPTGTKFTIQLPRNKNQ